MSGAAPRGLVNGTVPHLLNCPGSAVTSEFR